MDFINYLLPKIEHFRMLGYWLVLLISMLESLVLVGIFIPGAVFVVFAGALSAQGYFDLGDLIWFAAIGAVLGDGVSFMLGKRGILIFTNESRILNTSYLEKGKEFFQRHGGKSIFIGRFIGLIRAIIPFVAGLSGMDSKRFYLWNILSAFVWAVSHLLAGYFLGQAWKVLEVWSSRAGIFLAALLLFLACANFLKRFIARRGKELSGFCRSLLASVKQAIITNADMERLVQSHPSFFAFIGDRLDRSRFSGLTLTLLCIAFAYTLLLFLGVVEDVLTMDSIVAVDARVDNLLYFYRDPLLVKAFLWLTLLGKMRIVLSMALLCTLIFQLWKKQAYILPFWITVCGSGVFDLLGKAAFHRQRPPGIGVYTEASFSFPSGHATLAAALYGFIVYFLWRETDGWRNRLNILFAGVIIILSIGFSRLYLGVHFLSDVLGGYLLGLLCLIAGVSLVERRIFQFVRQARTTFPWGAAVLTALLIMAEAAFYIHSGVHYNPAGAPLERSETVKPVGADILGGFARFKLPRRTESINGEQQEPLNIIMAAKDDATLARAFQTAGWRPSDQINFTSAAKTAKALIFNESYPAAPITPSFWNGRVNEFGFEKQTSALSVRQRHHIRLWKTELATEDNRRVYVGMASFDTGVKWWLIHKISPSIDAEREYLFGELLKGGTAADYTKMKFVDPASGRNFSGDDFFTDGYLYAVYIR